MLWILNVTSNYTKHQQRMLYYHNSGTQAMKQETNQNNKNTFASLE